MSKIMRVASFALGVAFAASLASAAFAGGVSSLNRGGKDPQGGGKSGSSASPDSGAGNDSYNNPQGKSRGEGYTDYQYGDPGNSHSHNQAGDRG